MKKDKNQMEDLKDKICEKENLKRAERKRKQRREAGK